MSQQAEGGGDGMEGLGGGSSGGGGSPPPFGGSGAAIGGDDIGAEPDQAEIPEAPSNEPEMGV